VAAGFAIFRAIAQFFPIFEADSHEHPRAEMAEQEEDSVLAG
jgi:hypothetical protein